MPRLMEDAMRFTKLAADCLLNLRNNGKSPNTEERYSYTYGAFKAYLDHQKLDDDARHLNEDTIAGFMTWRATQKPRRRGAERLSPNTMSADLAALSKVANYAMKHVRVSGKPLMTYDPTKTYGERPVRQRPATTFLFLHEQAALKANPPAALNEDFAVSLVLETGLRAGEVCRANVADLVVQGDRYHLAVTVKGAGRAVERMYIPLSDDLSAKWERWMLARNPRPDAPLLVNANGERYTRHVLTRMVTRAAQRAGITRTRVTAHVLRHTVHVNARAAGIDRETRARMMNHTSTATLDRYDHLIPGELAQARDALKVWQDAQLGRVQCPSLNPALEPGTFVHEEGTEPTAT